MKTKAGERQGNIAAIGGMLGAVLVSSCCLGPLVLVTLGASGAWIGNLTALSAYQPVFATAAFVLLVIGFWGVYGSQRRACNQTAPCKTPVSRKIVRTILWVATLLLLLALTVDLWAPFFY
jgi:mercuric ion transport protein